MTQFHGQVAVITGAASGIGLALASRCADAGMRLALADLDSVRLAAVADRFTARGHEVLQHPLDVSCAADMEAFADRVHREFGTADLLFNNAGVGGGGLTWEVPLAEWQWQLGVNLWGVIHGIHYFVPGMVQQDKGYIINTASIAGLMHVAGMSTYNTAKAAVVALSETLLGDLRAQHSNIGVSVLCPSFVNTNVFRTSRYHPAALDGRMSTEDRARASAGEELAAGFFSAAMPPEQVIDCVFEAIATRRFYVLTHPGSTDRIQRRLQAILDGSAPPFTGPEDFP